MSAFRVHQSSCIAVSFSLDVAFMHQNRNTEENIICVYVSEPFSFWPKRLVDGCSVNVIPKKSVLAAWSSLGIALGDLGEQKYEYDSSVVI